MATKRKGKKQTDTERNQRTSQRLEPLSPVILRVQPSSYRAVHTVTGESASMQAQSLRKSILDTLRTFCGHIWKITKALRVSHGIPSCHTESSIKQFRALQHVATSHSFRCFRNAFRMRSNLERGTWADLSEDDSVVPAQWPNGQSPWSDEHGLSTVVTVVTCCHTVYTLPLLHL